MTDRDNYLPNIAYFAMRSTLCGEGHFGAALVVDAKGIPLEFRCSVPVRPSAIQTALYGDRIRDYTAFNLCGQPLLESLTVKPTVCLVESESQFDLQGYVSIPVFHAYRADSSSDGDSGNGDRGGSAQYRQLLQSHRPSITTTLDRKKTLPTSPKSPAYALDSFVALHFPKLFQAKNRPNWGSVVVILAGC